MPGKSNESSNTFQAILDAFENLLFTSKVGLMLLKFLLFRLDPLCALLNGAVCLVLGTGILETTQSVFIAMSILNTYLLQALL
jgi:hypothetical protein